ncbi:MULTISPECIES: hypothetical protein [Sphingobacterium]|jgi:hypothetical protein|uniref:Uncharacterized protein n=1 Tax=Sphingobacterium litopenaei TaxID=2763500 RepID=A0ABR7Y9N2_9SPHI|nr:MULTISPECIES: hypothetical protein [Sphingobacterium]MBD1428006.1 hypothetical protein [Sphingobacterium litopenaei]NGM71994.1 hypothetical protein [Sphingobacterium sp. SGL-16]
MVENFTQTEHETYTNEVEELIEDTFEAKIKEEIKNLVIEPNQNVIGRILQYSKTFSKK